ELRDRTPVRAAQRAAHTPDGPYRDGRELEEGSLAARTQAEPNPRPLARRAGPGDSSRAQQPDSPRAGAAADNSKHAPPVRGREAGAQGPAHTRRPPPAGDRWGRSLQRPSAPLAAPTRGAAPPAGEEVARSRAASGAPRAAGPTRPADAQTRP